MPMRWADSTNPLSLNTRHACFRKPWFAGVRCYDTKKIAALLALSTSLLIEAPEAKGSGNSLSVVLPILGNQVFQKQRHKNIFPYGLGSPKQLDNQNGREGQFPLGRIMIAWQAPP